LFGIVRDFTERKLAEERMRLSEERFSNLFLEMVSGCSIQEIICDEQGMPIDYITLDVNKSFERILNVHKEDVIGKRASEILTAEELSTWIKIFGEVAINRHSKPYEQFSPTNNKYFSGKVFSPQRKQFAVTFEDITERRQAHEMLSRSESNLKKAQHYAHIGSWTWNIKTNKLEWSDEMFHLFGIDKETFSGSLPEVIAQAIHPDDRAKVELSNLSVIKNKKPIPLEYRIVWPDKSVHVVWAEAGELLVDEGGNPWLLSGIVQDITERKLAEEKIQDSLKEKEVLLREIHHRVKNNMQIISSLLNLQMGYVKDKNIKDIFSESKNRILSMALVHEKLYQSRDLRTIDFKQYIYDLGTTLLQSYNINFIKLNLDVEDISLDIDLATPAGLIINELITNSLKYAFPDRIKGEINISFRSIDENMLELVVSDNGIGIPKDLDIRNSKTLGLHLVTSLAEMQLHGKIVINRDKGTEFQIKFKGRK
jgi:PAS domain S-box-containing protein